MKPEEIDDRISPSDWDETPESVKAVVVGLVEQLKDIAERYVLISSQIEPLAEQMDELEKQLARKKSRTSRRGFG